MQNVATCSHLFSGAGGQCLLFLGIVSAAISNKSRSSIPRKTHKQTLVNPLANYVIVYSIVRPWEYSTKNGEAGWKRVLGARTELGVHC